MKYPILLPNIFNYPFTYESNLDLKIGEYVSVPFGKNKLTGVVWDKLEENEQKKFKLKKVFKKLKVKPLKNNYKLFKLVFRIQYYSKGHGFKINAIKQQCN